MPRDVHGRAVRGERPAESQRIPRDKEADSEEVKGHERKDLNHFDKIDGMLAEHHDRLTRVEGKVGISHKPDDMKSEDQASGSRPNVTGGKKAPQAGYGRKRH